MESHERSSGHLLDDINVSGRAEFTKLVPKHRSVESELSSSGFVCDVTAWHTRPKLTLTLTRPCQFARVAFPAFKAERIRGIFLIPPSWLCIIFAMSRFSGRVKHSTASWRALMTARESDGLRSHVRSSERPSVVLVQSSVPNYISSTQIPMMRGGWNADRTVTIPPWFS